MAFQKLQSFHSARSKIERANEHIANYKVAFDAFVQCHPHTFSIGNDPKTGSTTVEVHFREQVPAKLPLILGDAIHNLRTALDHATWELIGLDGGTQDRMTKFPIDGTQRDYKASCERIKTPRSDTKKFFVSFAAYPTGDGERIYGLHQLDNADKHKVLTAIIGVASIPHLKVINPDGSTLLTMTNCKFGMGPDGRARMLGLGPGCTIQFDQDADPAIDIFFGDVKCFQSSPVVQTLEDLSNVASDIIGQFEGFVITRT